MYTERKEAGAAIIETCKALKAAGTEGRIGSYGAFELHSRFDNFDKVFRLSIKGAWNCSMEVGKDPQGNILRVTNALAGIERALPQVERRLETLEQQLAQASLRQMAQTDLRNVNRKELVDINDVEIKKDLSQRERMVDFVSQIKNPYCYLDRGMVVKISFAGENRLEDTLKKCARTHRK